MVFAGSALEGNYCVEFCVDISDLKKSESAFHLEHDFSNAVIDSLPGSFYCIDENLKFKRWNKNFEIVTGYGSDEIAQMSLIDFFTGVEKDLVADRIRDVFNNGSANVEAHFVSKDGTSTPFFFSGLTAVIDGQKHLVGVGIDISERKRSEKALQESELRFATLFEKSAHAVTLSSLPDGVILNVNGAFERTFGFSKEEAIGKTALDLGINPDFEDRQNLYADLQKYGYVRNLELELHIKSGEKRLFSINSDLIEIGNEKFFLNTIDDITERKQAEEKQSQTFELLTNLASLVPGVIYQYRLYPDGRSAFPYSSPGMYSIYEVTPEQVREDATPVFGRLHPDDADRVSNLIFESARTLEEFYCEFRVILPGQGLRWRWSQAHPERLPDGGTLWHGIISDITDRKLVEQALRESQEQFQIAQDMSPDGFTILRPERDAQGRIVDFTWVYENAAVARLNGTNPEAVVGQRLLEVFPGHRGTPLLVAYQKVAETGETCIFEADYSGESMPKPTSFRIVVVPMAGDIAILAQDITERKQVEVALRESEDRFRRAVTSAPIPIMIHAEDGQVLTINTPWTRLTGYEHSDIPTIADWTRKAYGTQMDLVRKEIDHLYSMDGSKAEGEYTINTSFGEQRIWDFSSAPIGQLPDGRRMVISMAMDVTERKKVEMERMKFFLLAESSSEFIGMCDLDMNPLYVNPAGQRLVGLPDMAAPARSRYGLFLPGGPAIHRGGVLPARTARRTRRR